MMDYLCVVFICDGQSDSISINIVIGIDRLVVYTTIMYYQDTMDTTYDIRLPYLGAGGRGFRVRGATCPPRTRTRTRARTRTRT